MKKRMFIFVSILFLLASLSFVLPADEEVILRISSNTNAHAEVWNGVNNYPVVIDFSQLFSGKTIPPNPHDCRTDLVGGLDNTVLWLYQLTNSHASTNNENSYNEQVCYGNLSCTNRTTCNAGETEVLALTGLTNAHLGIAGTSYSQKICCQVVEPNCIPNCDGKECGSDGCGGSCGTCTSEEYCNPDTWTCDSTLTRVAAWKSQDGSTILSGDVPAVIDFTVLMLSYSSGSPNTEISFKIHNYQGEISNIRIIDSAGDRITTIQTDSSGNAEVFWIPTELDVGNFSDNNDVKFIVSEGADVLTESNVIQLVLDFGLETFEFCSSYSETTQGECEGASTEVVRKSVDLIGDSSKCVNLGYTIPGSCPFDYYTNCRCVWNDTSKECKADFEPYVNDCSGAIFGGKCSLVNQAGSDNCDDGVLHYDLIATWIFDTNFVYTEQERDDIIADNSHLTEDDFVSNAQGGFYYNPFDETGKRRSEIKCYNIQNTVPCLSQLKLPFFGWFGFVVSLIGILGISFVLENRNN